MDAKIKKIIAREGLIILGFAVLNVLIYLTGGLLIKMYTPPYLKEHGIISTEELFGPGLYIQQMVPYIALFSITSYALYLIIRFVIWAIKTLKQ